MPTSTLTPPSAFPQTSVVDGDGIIDLTALEGAEQGITDSVATEMAADPVTAPLVLETYLAYRGDQFLVNNPTWRHFWMGIGNDLSTWLSNAGSALFGTPSDTVTHEELRLSSNLAVHTAMAAVRQLLASVNGRLRVSTTRLVQAVNSIAHHVRTNKLVAHSEALHVDAHALALHAAAVAYADARAHQVGVASEAYTTQGLQGLQQWTITHIAQPMADRLDAQQGQINDLQHQAIVHNNAIHDLEFTLGAAVAALHQMEPQLSKVLTETEQCTEPMCEYVGPKTDWGKLLSKFGPTAIWALLAEIAALDPKAVEAASEALATALGPVLERFAEAWIGVLPGGTGTEVSEVESHVGTFNPLGLGGL